MVRALTCGRSASGTVPWKAGLFAQARPETTQFRRRRTACVNYDPHMIPISDDNPGRNTPIVTWAIIALCVMVYLWERQLGHEMDAPSLVLGFKPDTLVRPHAPSSTDIAVPAIGTIFISMFLHGSVLHIAGNMLYLWIFGNNVEDAMGHVRFLLFYLVCGVAAALTLAWMDPGSRAPMIGASGAISGVLAGYVLLFPRARVTVIVPLGIIFFPLRISAFWVVGFWFRAAARQCGDHRPRPAGRRLVGACGRLRGGPRADADPQIVRLSPLRAGPPRALEPIIRIRGPNLRREPAWHGFCSFGLHRTSRRPGLDHSGMDASAGAKGR
jgi:membrane associated rhomboid family serine protease